MRILLRASLVAVALSLSACADFKVVKQFAGETTGMTVAVKEELSAIAALCNDAADLRLLLAESGVGNVAPQQESKKICREETEKVIAYQAVTTDVLELYAKTLLAMVDDSNFGLEASIASTGNKLGALKTKDGALIDAKKVGAITKVLSLLTDVIVQRQREEGIRRLVAAGPDLIANAQEIKRFLQIEYQGRVTRAQALANGGVAMLGTSGPLATNEPIRAAELRRALEIQMSALGRRTADGPVPKQLIAALDDWIALVPEFQRDALKRDPQALIQRIRDFGKKAGEAREAVEAAF